MFWVLQGSYVSGKCRGNFNFFKVRELPGNFMLIQGKMNVFYVREFYNFQFVSSDEKQKMTRGSFLYILDTTKSCILIASRLFRYKKMEGFGSSCLLNCLLSSPEPKTQVRYKYGTNPSIRLLSIHIFREVFLYCQSAICN